MSDLDSRSDGMADLDDEDLATPAVAVPAGPHSANLADETDLRPDGPPPPAMMRLPSGLRRRLAARLCRIPGTAHLVRRLLPVPSDPAVAYPSEFVSHRVISALTRQTRELAMQRLQDMPCFPTAEYLGMHPDVAGVGMDPRYHALFYGGFEERRVFRAAVLARALAAPLPPPAVVPAAPARTGPVALYVSSLGNIFMREIAEDLAASLRGAGAEVAILDETAPIAERPANSIIVAPHEFFLLGRGLDWIDNDVIAGAVMLNTEQPQTRWFGRALAFLLAARGVIDICAQAANLFDAAGVPSLHLSLAPTPGGDGLIASDRTHALFRILPQAARTTPSPATPFAARPIDIAFFGTESPHREAWLARNAPALADFDCVIHYRREERGPIRRGSADHALTRIATHVAGHSKIALNLHRDAYSYLEWHRMVRQGIATGAVVVSEPCLPHPLLLPGVHYLAESSRQITNLIEWLLRSEDGRRTAEEVRANARALLATGVTQQATAAQTLGFLAALGKATA